MADKVFLLSKEKKINLNKGKMRRDSYKKKM